MSKDTELAAARARYEEVTKLFKEVLKTAEHFVREYEARLAHIEEHKDDEH